MGKITYDVYETPTTKNEQPVTYHARTTKSITITYRQLIAELVHASTATEGDVALIIEGITHLLVNHLAHGEKIQIGPLGSFSVGISAPANTRPQGINATQMKVKTVNFRPTRKLVADIREKAEFQRTRNKIHSKEYSDKQMRAILLRFFDEYRFITRRDFQLLCEQTRTTALRRLKKLCTGDVPLLQRDGPKGSSIYFPTLELIQDVEYYNRCWGKR